MNDRIKAAYAAGAFALFVGALPAQAQVENTLPQPIPEPYANYVCTYAAYSGNATNFIPPNGNCTTAEDLRATELSSGWTPLHYGAVRGHLDVVNAILALATGKATIDNRTNNNSSYDWGGKTALWIAYWANQKTVADVIHRAGGKGAHNDYDPANPPYTEWDCPKNISAENAIFAECNDPEDCKTIPEGLFQNKTMIGCKHPDSRQPS